MLQPFVVSSWHGAGTAEMTADVKEIFTQSALSKDPSHSNLYAFILDDEGRLVRSFHGLPARGRGGDGRSDFKKEIAAALVLLKHPGSRAENAEVRPVCLPDLKATASGVPAGVRMFLRVNDDRDVIRRDVPVIEIVPMAVEQWNSLAFPTNARAIDPEPLRNVLIQLYPAGIRTADQSRPFRVITGTLMLEPAGADKDGRYALLRGKVRLTKGDNQESAFEGTLQAVLTYPLHSAQVQNVRAVIEGDYMYRIRGTQRIPLQAAIESRPE
jgi:hypothetical protein